jgi:hypothetical protein
MSSSFSVFGFFLLLLLASLFFLTSSSILRTSSSVVASNEDVNDRQEVFLQLFGARLCLTVNHDFGSEVPEEPLHQFERESTESVSVGNHNFFEFSSAESFQKGEKTSALPIESRADVGNDFVVWVLLTEVRDLPLEVFLLLFGRDSGIAHSDSLGGSFRFVLLEQPGEVSLRVESFAGGLESFAM